MRSHIKWNLRKTRAMPMGPLDNYRAMIASGEIEPDPAQLVATEHLDRLATSLGSWRPARGGLFARFSRTGSYAPRGVYIHGAVGRGKTMLMDLFYRASVFAPKRRLHFHAFMAEAHERIAAARQGTEGDPIPEAARLIAESARLLCFDELHVTDIADAMILGRLFKGMFDEGIVIVATSNAAPDALYQNGLNRPLFEPFIDLIERNMGVLELAAAKDFRLDKLAGQTLYYSPLTADARAGLAAFWRRLTGNAAGAPVELEVKGRRVVVPKAAMGVAWLGFADLCEQPLGSLDYLQLAHTFHTVILEGIPVLGPARRNEARRLINLIDTLYDNRTGLIASAEAEPFALYVAGDGADLFERTASRLVEMRSQAYLEDRAMRRSGLAGPAALTV